MILPDMQEKTVIAVIKPRPSRKLEFYSNSNFVLLCFHKSPVPNPQFPIPRTIILKTTGFKLDAVYSTGLIHIFYLITPTYLPIYFGA